MLSVFASALGLTLLVEIPLLFILVRCMRKDLRPPAWRIFCAGLLSSSASLPYFWFIFPELLPEKLIVPIGELLVILFEALLIYLVLNIGLFRSLIASAVCNLSSWMAATYLF